MKKTFCRILVIIMTVCFAACSSETNQSEKNNVGEKDSITSPMIVAGYNDLGLKADGTVVMNSYSKEYMKDWTNIVDISVADNNESATVGLKADGTVVVTTFNIDDEFGRCNVTDWTDIKDVAINGTQTIGVKSDGSVITTGEDILGLSAWTDIVSVDGGSFMNVVGLKKDGTCVVAGNIDELDFGQGNVENWSNLKDVQSGNCLTVGLKKDGTVVACGLRYSSKNTPAYPFSNNSSVVDVSDWTDIIDISVSGRTVIGLKADGTVVVSGYGEYIFKDEISAWNDIIDVSAQNARAMGLKKDGTVVCVGESLVSSEYSDWDLIN